MANKSANVTARVEPEVKERAEFILGRMGIPASVAINMFYHQVIYANGLPFTPSLPAERPASLDRLSRQEFDSRMAAGLAQAKAGEGRSADTVFDELTGGTADGR